jgi:hypothetical protein
MSMPFRPPALPYKEERKPRVTESNKDGGEQVVTRCRRPDSLTEQGPRHRELRFETNTLYEVNHGDRSAVSFDEWTGASPLLFCTLQN